MYRAELNYTLDDMRRFEKLHQLFRSRALYIVLQVVMIVGIVLVIGAGGLLLYFRAWDGEMLRYYVFLLVLFVLYFVLRELRVRTSLKSLSAQGTIVVTADDSGLHAAAKTMHSDFAYAGFCDVVHYKDSYYLYLDKRKAQIIPERCFVEGDPAAFGVFLEQKTGLKIKEIK